MLIPIGIPLAIVTTGERERQFAREEDMKKILRFIIPFSGLVAVLIFGANATASISNAASVVTSTFSKPGSLLLIVVGVGLFGFGSYINKRSLRS